MSQTSREPAIVEAKPGELKPCPFCGSEAAFEHDSTGTLATWRAYCRDPEDECPMGLTNTRGYARRVEAATAWNTRRREPVLDSSGIWTIPT